MEPRLKMVCISAREVERLEHENPDLRGRFINYTDRPPRMRENTPVVVDNADLILASLLGRPIQGVSITG